MYKVCMFASNITNMNRHIIQRILLNQIRRGGLTLEQQRVVNGVINQLDSETGLIYIPEENEKLTSEYFVL